MYIQPLYPQTNWILNATGESNVNGWNLYNNGSSATPTTGTGGTPANITIAQTTTNPISGLASLLVTKNAANVQGEGLSYDFTVDRANLARIQQISFTIELTTGSMALGDLTMWIYDKTNSVLIQPVQYQFPSATVGTSPIEYQVIGTFQTNITSTSYRLICHFSTTVTGALTFKMDNVVVGPQVLSYGSPDSDWVSYTPTITSNGGTNPTLGTNTMTGRWKRVGDSAEIVFELSQTSAGTIGSGTYLVSMPPGLTADTTKIKLPSNGGSGTATFNLIDGTALGSGCIGNTLTPANNSAYSGTTVVAYDSTHLTISLATATTQASPWAASGGYAMNNTDIYAYFRATVPILGWSSAVRMSQPDATRTVAAHAFMSTNQSCSGGVQANFDTVVYDTHAAITTGAAGSSGTWKFTCPVTGWYNIDVFFSGSATGYLQPYKNGTASGTLSYISGSLITSGSFLISLNAGDYIDVRPSTSQTISGGSSESSVGVSNISVFRVAGPERIAASEKVHSEYNSNAGQSITSSVTVIVYTTLVYDSHGAYNTTSGVWTAPRAGTVVITGMINWTGSQTGNLVLVKNSSNFYSGVTSTSTLQGASWQTYVNAGDQLWFKSTSTGTIASSNALGCYCCFTMS